jgi:hypothetical protein
MEINFFIESLHNSARKIEQILADITSEQALWKPEPAKWSILEVVNHLYDEERDDFRKRFDLTLHHPDQSWPGIDPQTWAVERGYNKRDFHTSLNNFLTERQKSLTWLRSLGDADLAKSYVHPVVGTLAAGDLLAAWAAHDYLHLRQLADLQARYLNIQAAPFSTRYASPLASA